MNGSIDRQKASTTRYHSAQREVSQLSAHQFLLTAHFPPLDEDAVAATPITFGPYCENPYEAQSIINISGMSFGALSRPAVRALSKGAKLANCWLNTGEGGVSKWHLEGGCDIVFQIGTAKYGVRNDDGGLDEEKLKLLRRTP